MLQIPNQCNWISKQLNQTYSESLPKLNRELCIVCFCIHVPWSPFGVYVWKSGQLYYFMNFLHVGIYFAIYRHWNMKTYHACVSYFPTGCNFVFCCSNLTNCAIWLQHWLWTPQAGLWERGLLQSICCVYMYLLARQNIHVAPWKTVRFPQLSYWNLSWSYTKGLTVFHTCKVLWKSIRQHCIMFFKMNCFLSSERKLVTTTSIHISQFPFKFHRSTNIILSF